MESVKMVNTPLPDVIELRNVKQVYGEVKVIEDLNLIIEDRPNTGQFVCLLGVSGCGKSTVLRYIAGLQKPTSGDVLLYGKPLDGNKVGMIFQQYSSQPWRTVLENVTLGLEIQNIPKKERIERAMEFIKICDLEQHKNKYCKYPTLSGGQLQRVAIARSLVANPKLLLLDEPFGALDVNTRLKMQDTLMSIWERLWKIDTATTFVFVTHDIPEAVYLGTDIYIMQTNPGKIVHYIKINLPFDKTRQVKRNPGFAKYVYDIEDKMMELAK
jgi:NitT/TauT family transport system ATP-binding protein